MTFLDEPVGAFEGTVDNSTSTTDYLLVLATNLYNKAAKFGGELMEGIERVEEMVDSRDHDLHYYYQRVVREGTAAAYQALEKEVAHREFTDKLFHEAFEYIENAPETPQNFDCLRTMVEGVEERCGRFSAYSMKYVRKLANICDTHPDLVDKTLDKASDFCSKAVM